MLEDVFENFRNKCIEIYKLDPAHFLSAPELAWQACLKKTEVELAIHRYAKANKKYLENCDKNIESSSTEFNSVELSYLMYLDPNNLHGLRMSQKLPVNGFLMGR